jgi:hypothetical protein
MHMGEDFKFTIETATPGTFIVVKGMNNWSTGGSRSESKTHTFDEDDPIITLQSEEDTFAIGGVVRDKDDAGLALMLSHRAAKTTVNVQALIDGTNGSKIPVKVRSRTWGAAAEPGSPQTISFELVRDGEVTEVGTGPIL